MEIRLIHEQHEKINDMNKQISELSKSPKIKAGEYSDQIDETVTYEYIKDSGFHVIDIDLSEEMQAYTYALCESYAIDYSLVLAVMEQESGFDADLISSTNDYGLMQINKCNHIWISNELGVSNFLDEKQNATAGVYILANLFEKYNDIHRVLMSYNMGEYGARKLWENGIRSSKYSRAVLERQKKIKKIEQRDVKVWDSIGQNTSVKTK